MDQCHTIFQYIRKNGPLWLPGIPSANQNAKRHPFWSSLQCQGPEATEREGQESQAQDQFFQLGVRYLRQVAATWRMNTKTRGLPQPQICLRQDLSMQQGKGQGLRVAPMEGRGGAGGATPRLTFPPLPYSPVILSAKALRYPLSQTHELGPSQSSSPTSICFLPPSPPLLIFPFVSETM